MTTKQSSIFPPSPPPPPSAPYCAASSRTKIGLGGVDLIVERQLAARVRRIEATLDREHELRLYGGRPPSKKFSRNNSGRAPVLGISLHGEEP
jgi:hypothetical protein